MRMCAPSDRPTVANLLVPRVPVTGALFLQQLADADAGADGDASNSNSNSNSRLFSLRPLYGYPLGRSDYPH